MDKNKKVKIVFVCGHVEEVPAYLIKDLPSNEYCSSCIELYHEEWDNMREQQLEFDFNRR